jgi:hypothetical protein
MKKIKYIVDTGRKKYEIEACSHKMATMKAIEEYAPRLEETISCTSISKHHSIIVEYSTSFIIESMGDI